MSEPRFSVASTKVVGATLLGITAGVNLTASYFVHNDQDRRVIRQKLSVPLSITGILSLCTSFALSSVKHPYLIYSSTLAAIGCLPLIDFASLIPCHGSSISGGSCATTSDTNREAVPEKDSLDQSYDNIAMSSADISDNASNSGASDATKQGKTSMQGSGTCDDGACPMVHLMGTGSIAAFVCCLVGIYGDWA